MIDLDEITRLQNEWQNRNETYAKFCVGWDRSEWEEFILYCDEKGLDIDEECQRLYEERGDF